MKRWTRHAPTPEEVHAAYLPDVPFASLSGMAVGKAAPETPAEAEAVIARIKREADTRLTSRDLRLGQQEREMSEAEIDQRGRDLLGL